MENYSAAFCFNFSSLYTQCDWCLHCIWHKFEAIWRVAHRISFSISLRSSLAFRNKYICVLCYYFNIKLYILRSLLYCNKTKTTMNTVHHHRCYICIGYAIINVHRALIHVNVQCYAQESTAHLHEEVN